MRLTCPNCDAQYEIEASLIPDEGRDVQCSNCGKTWFQPPEGGLVTAPDTADAPDAPEAAPEPAGNAAPSDDASQSDVDLSGLTEEAAAFFGSTPPGQAKVGATEDAADGFADDNDLPEPLRQDDDMPAPAWQDDDMPAPLRDGDDGAETWDQDDDLPEPADDADAGSPIPEADLPRREMDPKVREILREEAEREIAARRAERGEVIETQAEMGLEPVAVPAAAATARLRGDPVDPESADEDSLRKSMLPDVDEINSTLTATSDRPDRVTTQEEIDETIKRRSGFRIGFAVMLGLAMLLIVLYLSAPALGRMIPALEPMLAGYVDWANSMRLGIDSLLERTLGTGS